MIYRSEKYKAFIRRHPCPVCMSKEVEAHHVRRHYWGAGTGIKPTDLATVPRCRSHHGPDYEADVEREIIGYLMEYITQAPPRP